MKLKPAKCHFFQKELKFLGHLVNNEGIKPDMDKVKEISKLIPPKDVSQL